MLVERDALVARLRDLAAGPGALVAVSGEAGAGKSALVSAALPGAVTGWCEPLVPPRPLTPWRDVLRELGAGAPDGDWGDILLAALNERPRVVLIEDGHWIDEASAHVLRFLGRRIRTSSSLLVVTFRDGLATDHPLTAVLGATDAHRIEVPALSRAAVAELVGPDGVADAVRLTGGNAFLVSQLVDRPAGSIASPLRDAVAGRLAALPDAARRLVELLAVVPGRLHPVLLDGAWPAVDDAVRAGLLELRGHEVRFRHELVRRAVEAESAPGARIARHADVLRRLQREADADPATLAFHARAARRPDLAHGYARAAAERAVASGSHREAAEQFADAVATMPATVDGATAARLWWARSREESVTGRDEAAHASALRALELCPQDDVPLRAQVVQWLARVVASEQEAMTLAAEAVALVEPLGAGPDLGHAYARLATVQMVARDLPAAIATARQALAASDDAETAVVALQALGAARTLSGDDPSCRELWRAVSVARDAGAESELGRAYANLVSAAGEERCYDVSRRAADEALAYFVGHDLDGAASYTRAWYARCLFEQGDWSAATAWVDEILAVPDASSIATITAWCVRGRIRTRRGDPHADEALAAAKVHADATGALQRVAPVEAGRAEARRLAGVADDGSDGLSAAYALAVSKANPWAVGELGLWLWRAGLLDTLPAVAAEPYRAHVGGDVRHAARLWADLGCPYEQADALCDADDEDSVRTALELFTGLGAAPGRRRAARRLRELGVRAIPRGPRTTTASGPDGLTAREQEVLGHVRDGSTDAEIAAALHLSVKTVGHHVSAVLRKTGSSSRRELQRRPTWGAAPHVPAAPGS